ncbi:ATP-binding cassette domain-containing protein [Allokutzneria sp. A3M-2-11 16]|uniref:ABC transporter ATP-binding protein n=1 Tax=Allokutzneria sp. A3M-2-11 16 TaxID=2962043 RepID=UPI0020B6E765|nr:ATP-binding cassette domain-containing protein [Allokutzneria sp. A3M-2-11 16]MCP3803736.1 ATP-binding cassette domain-containing protein [Allokutzneria sp. A3M-2-11 16]
MSTVLSAHEIRRSFGTVEVLSGVDLEVAAGEFVTLAGPSGSGKSALFAVLSGFDTADSGEVLLLGERMTAPPAWTDCAVLPQVMGLADELTVAENVALPLRLRGEEHAARVTELLDELGIGALGDRYPTELSFGQRQRAALARALAPRPRLLLADEPTAHLDHATVPLVLGLLRRAAEEGAAVLVATHDKEVHEAAHRQLRLVEGRVS